MRKRSVFFAIIIALTVFTAVVFSACTVKDDPVYKISFYNGESVFATVETKWGEAVSFPAATPTKESDDNYDYVFLGWANSPDSTQVVSGNVLAYSDMSFYAIFSSQQKDPGIEEKIYFTVTFVDDLTDEIIGEIQQIESGSDAVLPEPPDHTAEGYIFSGWSGSHENIKRTTTIRALYELNRVTLTRHYLGQTREESVVSGSEISTDAPTISSAFVFEGWFWDEALTDAVRDGNNVVPFEAADIYAKISVNFSTASLTADSELVYGNSNTVSVSGLMGEGTVEYSYEWSGDEGAQSGASDAQRVLRDAGEYALGVTVTATYSYNGTVVLTDSMQLSERFEVAKATLNITISALEQITYGTEPQIEVNYDGFKFADGADTVELSLTYMDESGNKVNAERLPAGEYTVACTAGESENYTVPEIEDITFTVNKKDLTVGFTVRDYTYGDELGDGFTLAQFIYDESELAYDDGISALGEPQFEVQNPSYSANYPEVLNKGTYTIKLVGLISDNYNVIDETGTDTFTVSPRQAVVEAIVADWTYGENAKYSINIEGVLDGDVAALNVSYVFTQSGAPFNPQGSRIKAGNYTVTADYTNNANYAFAQSEAKAFTVHKATVTADIEFTNASKIDGVWSYVYGVAPMQKITYSGFIDNDEEIITQNVAVVYDDNGKTGNAAMLDAGQYEVLLSGLDDLDNYVYTKADGKVMLGVSKKPLTVTVELSGLSTEFTYGDNNNRILSSFSYTHSELAYGQSLSVALENLSKELVSGEQTVTAAMPSVGSYYVTVAFSDARNYDVTVVPMALTVGKAELKLSIEDEQLVYGDKPTGSLTVENFKGTDEDKVQAVLTYTKDGKEFSLSDILEVGEYEIKVSWTDESVLANYEWTQPDGTVTVVPKQITLSLTAPTSVTFGTEIEPEYSFDGFVYGENESVFHEIKFIYYLGENEYQPRQFADKELFDVGQYRVVLDYTDNANYTVSGEDEIEFAVTAKSVLVADSEVLGRLNNTWSFTPTVSGYDFDGSLQLNATDAGVYTWNESNHDGEICWADGYSISLEGQDITANFVLSYDVSVELTATEFKFAAPDDQSFVYDAHQHIFPVSVEGILYEQDAGTEIKVEYSLDQTEYSELEPSFVDVGEYTVYYRISASNYVTRNGSFTVYGNMSTDNTISGIKVRNESYVYDAIEHVYDISASATFGDVEVYVNGEFITESIALIDAGTYVFTFTVQGDENYESVTTTRTVTITKANYTVTENKPIENYVFNGNAQGHGVTVKALENDELPHVSYSYGGETIEAATFVNAGSYTVEWFIAESANYFEQSGSYEIAIGKAHNEITTQFDDHAFSYDGENHVMDMTATATYGTVTVTYEGTELSAQYTLKNVGEYEFVFTVLESQNYLQSAVTRTVSVYRGDYAITENEDQTDYVFDGNAYGHGITVSAFSGDEIPTVAYMCGGQPIENISFIQAGDYVIEWSIAQSDNYNGATGSFLVRINRFTIVVDTEKTTQSYVYNATAQGEGIAMANVAPDGGYTVYYSEQGYSQGTADFTTQPFSYVNAGVYTVYYRITGDNYTTVTGSYTVTVTPKTLTVSGLPAGDVRQDYGEAGYTVPELGVNGVEDADAGMVNLSVSVTKNGSQVTEIKNKGLYYVNYNVTIDSAVASNYSVNSGSGYYTVTINGIKLTLDASMIKTSYAYTGYEQTVDFTSVKIMYGDTELTLAQLQQDDSTTRIEYTASKGSITNEGVFSFTNVIDANGAIITVYLIVGANSNYASAEVAVQLAVAKANYAQGDVPQVQTSEQIMMLGKTIGQVELSESFAWADGNEVLLLGTNEYKAYYNADPDNYNDYELYVEIVARKEIVTLTYTECVEAVLGEINADNYKQTFVVTAYGELDRGDSTVLLPSELEGKIIYTVSGASYTVGSTYIVTYSLQFVPNDYFELDSSVVTSVTTWFKLKSVLVDGNYYTIEDALNEATSGVAKLIGGATQFTDLSTKAALSQMGTPLYEGDEYYTVKSGVTLVLPINSTDNGTLEIKSDYTKLFTSGTNLYSKLTVSQGITLYVNGTLIVNGARKNGGSGNHMSNTDKAYGYSELVIMEDSTVIVSDGAKMYSYGFSYGDGEIVARSGSTVTEPFCLTGWKGGTISSAIVQKVFPINQYALANIVCLLRIEYGASYNVRAALSGSLLITTQYVDVDVEFISMASSAFIQMSDGGYIEKYIDTANGDHVFNVHSNVTFNNISIDIVVSASTRNLQVPIPGHFKLNLIGSDATVPSGVKLKFLPGATVTVDKDSSIIINNGGAAYFYGEQGVTLSEGLTYWQDGNNKLAYPIAALKSVYLTTPTFGYGQTTPARFINYGTVTVRSGGVFAANAEGAEGAKIIIEAGAKLSDSFDEDYTVYGSNALNTKAAYFTASFEAYGIGNTDFALIDDGSYVYYDGDWQRVEPFKYTIVYDANGGLLSGDSSQSFTIYITEPLLSITLNDFDTPDPTHLLGLFNGWYLDAQCTQPVDMSNPLTVNSGDEITVYAGWDKITYTVEYVVEDGANNQELVNGNATSWQMGETIELVDLIAQSGEFGGWFADERYQSAVSVIDDEFVKLYGYELDGNRYVRIYGSIFDLDKEFAVVYDLNLDGISSEYTDAFITELPTDNVVKINQAISGVADAANYNLYANDYDVTMQYYFAGWYVGDKLITDGTVIAFDDIVDGKLTLTAKWAQKIELCVTVTATGTSGGLLSKGSSRTATYSVSFDGTEYTDSQSATGEGGSAFYGSGKTETKTFSYYLVAGQSYTVTATEGSGGASGTAAEGDTTISVTVQNS